MLWLNPQRVALGDDTLDVVAMIAIDRTTDRLALERSDLGPHAVFIDAPEQRAVVRIVRELDGETTFAPEAIHPGAQLELSFSVAPNASDALRSAIAATVVVIAIEHDLSRSRGARQTITAIAVSPDGAADPFEAPKGGDR